MLRLVEMALFVAPFAVFAIWRLVAVDGPSIRLLLTAACLLAALAGVLIWLSQDEALPPGSTYVPARLQDGKVVAGHAAPQ
jgi:Family of unknown function (DUF6111)